VNHPIRQALALALLAGTGLSAQAQSTQIYGIADLYVGSLRGSDSRTVLNEGGNAASRLGFRGREDLGGGQSVYFTLEMGLTLDNGSIPLGGGFGRQSFVGLEGRWGAIEAGRQYTPLFFNLLATVPFGMNANWAPVQLASSVDGQPAQVRTLGQGMRQSNLVRYRYGGGPKAKGLRLDVAAAPDEGAAGIGGILAWGASYRGESFFIGYAGQRLDSGSAVATPFHNQSQGLNGSYSLGRWTLSGAYLVSDSTAPGARRAAHTVLGAAYDLGPHRWMAELNRRGLANSPNGARAMAIGYDHRLSKRTTVYGRVLHLQNQAAAGSSLALATVNAGSGDDVRALALGIRHNF
jgi:predicted porin